MSTLQANILKNAASASANITLNADGTIDLAQPLPIGDMLSGSWKLLNTLTASSSASLSDTTSFTSAYQLYAIVLQNIIPVTNAVNLVMTLQSGGSFQATTYTNGVLFWNSSGTAVGGITTGIGLPGAARMGNNASYGADAVLFLPNPASASGYKPMYGNGSYYDSTAAMPNAFTLNGVWKGGTGAITGIQFAMSSGNISSGTIKIYGIKA